MGNYIGGVAISGFVATTDTNDVYPTHLEELGKGGYRSTATVIDRDKITVGRRSIGMVVYVIEENKEYKLINGLTNDHWVYIPKTAYEIAVQNGYVGTVESWLASNKGTTGPSGKSTYEIAVQNGYVGTVESWLASNKGTTGPSGKSTYEIAVQNGYVGTVESWLNDLQNPPALSNYLPLAGGKMVGAITAIKETSVLVGNNNIIDVTIGNYFIKNINGNGILNIQLPEIFPLNTDVISIMVETINVNVTNIEWWPGIKWSNGVVPGITKNGTDLYGFIFTMGKWRGVLLSKDSR